jgi:citrate synthase
MEPMHSAQSEANTGSPVARGEAPGIGSGPCSFAPDADLLARSHSLEEVASLLWIGNAAQTEVLFQPENVIPAHKYEAILMRLEMESEPLSPLKSLITLLPIAAEDSRRARGEAPPPETAHDAARILRLMVSLVAGEVPEDIPLAEMLRRGWCPAEGGCTQLLQTALIVSIGQGEDPALQAVRAVRSAGTDLFGCVLAGLIALDGQRYRGQLRAVAGLIDTADGFAGVPRDTAAPLPGFGLPHAPEDPGAALVLALLAAHAGDDLAVLRLAQAIHSETGRPPALSFALVALTRSLKLPDNHALAILALARAIGWAGDALRPRPSHSEPLF